MADSTKKKNYAKSSAKLVSFDNGGELINLDLKIEGKVIGANGEILPNKSGYVKLTLSRLSKEDAYGNHYSVYENEYKSKEGEKSSTGQKPGSPTPAKAKITAPTDDFPFN